MPSAQIAPFAALDQADDALLEGHKLGLVVSAATAVLQARQQTGLAAQAATLREALNDIRQCRDLCGQLLRRGSRGGESGPSAGQLPPDMQATLIGCEFEARLRLRQPTEQVDKIVAAALASPDLPAELFEALAGAACERAAGIGASRRSGLIARCARSLGGRRGGRNARHRRAAGIAAYDAAGRVEIAHRRSVAITCAWRRTVCVRLYRVAIDRLLAEAPGKTDRLACLHRAIIERLLDARAYDAAFDRVSQVLSLLPNLTEARGAAVARAHDPSHL